MNESSVVRDLDNKFRYLKDFDDTNNLYTNWSITYDEEMAKPDGYKGFLMIPKLLDLFTYRNKEKQILDIGAGTGLVGAELRKMGYNHIDALEPNDAMRKLSFEKNVYNKIFSEIIHPDEPLKTIELNSYDRVTMAGCFAPGHMDFRHIKQIVRILKPGGMFIFCFRNSYVETHQREVNPEIERLQKENIIEITLRTVVPDYYPGVPCYMAVLTKL